MATETKKATWTRWFVQRDGQDISPARNNENSAYTWIMQHQGMSVDWAMKHEGYSIVSREVEIATPEHGWDSWLCLSGAEHFIKVDTVYPAGEGAWAVSGLARGGERHIALTDRQPW